MTSEKWTKNFSYQSWRPLSSHRQGFDEKRLTHINAHKRKEVAETCNEFAFHPISHKGRFLHRWVDGPESQGTLGLQERHSYSMGKVSVNQVKGKLYLLASLPPKSGSGPNKAQRVATGLDDTPADRKVADKRRAIMQRQVDTGTFAWTDWVDLGKGFSWKKAIDLLYRKRVVMGRTGQSTWDISYWGRLKQLPMTKVVTQQEVAKALTKYERDSASYKELFFLLKDLCKLINLEFPEMPVPTYGSKVKAPEVPDDDEIESWVKKAMTEDPELGWALGMMATYGLRPHELDECQFLDDRNRLEVPDETKTGDRIVVPLKREWVETFELRTEKRREKYSTAAASTSQWVFAHKKKLGFPYRPYALRHAYAGRLWRTGGSRLDVFTCAKLMGHSPKVHETTYRAWIRPHTIADRAEAALFGE